MVLPAVHQDNWGEMEKKKKTFIETAFIALKDHKVAKQGDFSFKIKEKRFEKKGKEGKRGRVPAFVFQMAYKCAL